jgi:hypothetical protein
MVISNYSITIYIGPFLRGGVGFVGGGVWVVGCLGGCKARNSTTY